MLKGKLKPAELDAIRQFLENEVRGVERVDVRRREKAKAKLVVKLRGKSEDLSRALESKKFDGFSLGLDRVTSNEVRLDVERGS